MNIPCALEKSKVDFKKGQLGSINLSCSIDLEECCLFFCKLLKGVKSYCKCGNIYISFLFIRFCSIYFETLTLDSYMLCLPEELISFINIKFSLFLWSSGCPKDVSSIAPLLWTCGFAEVALFL